METFCICLLAILCINHCAHYLTHIIPSFREKELTVEKLRTRMETHVPAHNLIDGRKFQDMMDIFSACQFLLILSADDTD